MKHGSTIALASLAMLSGLMVPSTAEAQSWLASPGIKLAYTFGEGFTIGGELSIVYIPKGDRIETVGDVVEAGLLFGWAGVFNVDYTFGASLTKFRLGGEWLGPGIGVEAGPTIVLDNGTPHFGLGYTVWAGTYTIPYYGYTFVFGREDNLHEIGSYFKVPLCVDNRDDCEDLDD